MLLMKRCFTPPEAVKSTTGLKTEPLLNFVSRISMMRPCAVSAFRYRVNCWKPQIQPVTKKGRPNPKKTINAGRFNDLPLEFLIARSDTRTSSANRRAPLRGGT